MFKDASKVDLVLLEVLECTKGHGWWTLCCAASATQQNFGLSPEMSDVSKSDLTKRDSINYHRFTLHQQGARTGDSR
jgi:hypothetical protein